MKKGSVIADFIALVFGCSWGAWIAASDKGLLWFVGGVLVIATVCAVVESAVNKRVAE